MSPEELQAHLIAKKQSGRHKSAKDYKRVKKVV